MMTDDDLSLGSKGNTILRNKDSLSPGFVNVPVAPAGNISSTTTTTGPESSAETFSHSDSSFGASQEKSAVSRFVQVKYKGAVHEIKLANRITCKSARLRSLWDEVTQRIRGGDATDLQISSASLDLSGGSELTKTVVNALAEVVSGSCANLPELEVKVLQNAPLAAHPALLALPCDSEILTVIYKGPSIPAHNYATDDHNAPRNTTSKRRKRNQYNVAVLGVVCGILADVEPSESNNSELIIVEDNGSDASTRRPMPTRFRGFSVIAGTSGPSAMQVTTRLRPASTVLDCTGTASPAALVPHYETLWDPIQRFALACPTATFGCSLVQSNAGFDNVTPKQEEVAATETRITTAATSGALCKDTPVQLVHHKNVASAGPRKLKYATGPNCAWHQITLNKMFPFLVLTSIPGVPIENGDELRCDRGRKWLAEECRFVWPDLWREFYSWKTRVKEPINAGEPVRIGEQWEGFAKMLRVVPPHLLCGQCKAPGNVTGLASGETSSWNVVICDGCDQTFHTWCVGYEKTDSPRDWFCDTCLANAARISQLSHHIPHRKSSTVPETEDSEFDNLAEAETLLRGDESPLRRLKPCIDCQKSSDNSNISCRLVLRHFGRDNGSFRSSPNKNKNAESRFSPEMAAIAKRTIGVIVSSLIKAEKRNRDAAFCGTPKCLGLTSEELKRAAIYWKQSRRRLHMFRRQKFERSSYADPLLFQPSRSPTHIYDGNGTIISSGRRQEKQNSSHNDGLELLVDAPLNVRPPGLSHMRTKLLSGTPTTTNMGISNLGRPRKQQGRTTAVNMEDDDAAVTEDNLSDNCLSDGAASEEYEDGDPSGLDSRRRRRRGRGRVQEARPQSVARDLLQGDFEPTNAVTLDGPLCINEANLRAKQLRPWPRGISWNCKRLTWSVRFWHRDGRRLLATSLPARKHGGVYEAFSKAVALRDKSCGYFVSRVAADCERELKAAIINASRRSQQFTAITANPEEEVAMKANQPASSFRTPKTQEFLMNAEKSSRGLPEFQQRQAETADEMVAGLRRVLSWNAESFSWTAVSPTGARAEFIVDDGNTGAEEVVRNRWRAAVEWLIAHNDPSALKLDPEVLDIIAGPLRPTGRRRRGSIPGPSSTACRFSNNSTGEATEEQLSDEDDGCEDDDLDDADTLLSDSRRLRSVLRKKTSAEESDNDGNGSTEPALRQSRTEEMGRQDENNSDIVSDGFHGRRRKPRRRSVADSQSGDDDFDATAASESPMHRRGTNGVASNEASVGIVGNPSTNAAVAALQPLPAGLIWARTTSRFFAVFKDPSASSATHCKKKRFKTFDPKKFGGVLEAFNAALDFLSTVDPWITKTHASNAGVNGSGGRDSLCTIGEDPLSTPSGLGDGTNPSRSGSLSHHDSSGGSDLFNESKDVVDPKTAAMESEVAQLPAHENIRWCRSKKGFTANYNGNTRWFSAWNRGVCTAFTLAVEWVQSRQSAIQSSSGDKEPLFRTTRSTNEDYTEKARPKGANLMEDDDRENSAAAGPFLKMSIEHDDKKAFSPSKERNLANDSVVIRSAGVNSKHANRLADSPVGRASTMASTATTESDVFDHNKIRQTNVPRRVEVKRGINSATTSEVNSTATRLVQLSEELQTTGRWDSDDSVNDSNEQARRLPKITTICWVPQKQAFSVFYVKDPITLAKTTKAFNPVNFNGVKRSFRHAVLFAGEALRRQRDPR